MATRSTRLSGPDRKGNYSRQLGYKLGSNGKRVQHKFRLGTDRAKAEFRAALLRQIWDQVLAIQGADNATWDEATLDIAKQVAKGISPVLLPHQQVGEHAYAYVERIEATRQRFPFLIFQPTYPPDGVGLVMKTMREEYEATIASSQTNGKLQQNGDETASTQTLHQALDAYAARCKEEYFDPQLNSLSDYGHTKLGQIASLRNRHDDVPIASLDLDAIETMFRYWRRRPESRAPGSGGKAMSKTSVRHYLFELTRFFKWLNRSKDFSWRLPEGFEDIDKRIYTDAKEIKASIRQVGVFQLDELRLLNRHATPFERLLLLLGLNCGFGAKEIATLTIGECFLRQGLPKEEQELFDFPTTDQQSFISLVRNKTTIVGKFLLFQQTQTMVEWAMQRRLQQPNLAPDQPLLLTSKNKPLDHRSASGNPSRLIANAFNRLKQRCKFNGDPVSDLPFKCLRKTAGDLIRRFSDGEVSGIFLLHGSPVSSDKLSDVYTNRPFGKVYRAIQAVESYLAPVLAESTRPTDDLNSDPDPGDIPAQIARLHAAGKSIREIQAAVGVSKSTVHREVKKINPTNSSG